MYKLDLSQSEDIAMDQNLTFISIPSLIENTTSTLLVNTVIVEGRSTLGIAFIAVAFITILLATILGNIAVISAIRSYTTLRNQQNNLFILNLAIADLCVALTVMIIASGALMADTKISINNVWAFNEGLCLIQCALNYCLIVVSMMTLGFISIDRYTHIVYPLRYYEIITVPKIKLMIVWTWIQGLVIGLVPVGMKWIHYDYCEVVCAINWKSPNVDVYVIVAFISCFLLPASIMLICYSIIFKHGITITTEIRRSMSMVTNFSPSSNNEDGCGCRGISNRMKQLRGKPSLTKISVRTLPTNSSSADTRDTEYGRENLPSRRHNSAVRHSTIVRSLLVVVFIFFICMTPFCLTKLLKVLNYKVPCWINTLATVIQLLSSACNPLIYGIFRKEYRNAFKHLFKRVFLSVGCTFSEKIEFSDQTSHYSSFQRSKSKFALTSEDHPAFRIAVTSNINNNTTTNQSAYN